MSKYEVKVENSKGEEVYKGEVELRSTDKAESFAQKVAAVAEEKEGNCSWEVKKK